MLSVAALTTHEYGTPDADTVLLLHGLTEAGTAWPDLVSHWREDWHILSPDLRGHGSSPRFTQEQLGHAPQVLLADVLDLLDSLAEPVVLVGHSLGGLLALRAAIARPEAVRALVLEDPARPSGSWTPDPQIVAWAQCKAQVDRRYIRRGLFLGDARWDELFDALTVPTLLVVPPDSPMAPDPARLRNPGVRTAVVPGAGHCVRRDQPVAYLAAVDGFLAALSEAGLVSPLTQRAPVARTRSAAPAD